MSASAKPTSVAVTDAKIDRRLLDLYRNTYIAKYRITHEYLEAYDNMDSDSEDEKTTAEKAKHNIDLANKAIKTLKAQQAQLMAIDENTFPGITKIMTKLYEYQDHLLKLLQASNPQYVKARLKQDYADSNTGFLSVKSLYYNTIPEPNLFLTNQALWEIEIKLYFLNSLINFLDSYKYYFVDHSSEDRVDLVNATTRIDRCNQFLQQDFLATCCPDKLLQERKEIAGKKIQETFRERLRVEEKNLAANYHAQLDQERKQYDTNMANAEKSYEYNRVHGRLYIGPSMGVDGCCEVFKSLPELESHIQDIYCKAYKQLQAKQNNELNALRQTFAADEKQDIAKVKQEIENSFNAAKQKIQATLPDIKTVEGMIAKTRNWYSITSHGGEALQYVKLLMEEAKTTVSLKKSDQVSAVALAGSAGTFKSANTSGKTVAHGSGPGPSVSPPTPRPK